MSEQVPQQSHEYQHSAEAHNHDADKLKDLIEQGKHARHEKAEKLDDIRAESQEHAVSAQETLSKQSEHDQRPAQSSPLVNKDLKDLKYKRTLQSVRKDLSVPERAFSKVVHNPGIERASEAAGKTIARPSGVLAGGFSALLGGSIYLYITKHYGYSYNFLFFILLFAAGFMFGLLVELLFRLLRRRSV